MTKSKIIELWLYSNYSKVNIIFAGIILALLIYSGIFSAENPHPIKSAHSNQVISTGLSRAFSEIVRLNFSQALGFNTYSLRIFSFFFFQFFLRVLFTFLMFRNMFLKKQLVIADIMVSVSLFLFAFGQFIIDQI